MKCRMCNGEYVRSVVSEGVVCEVCECVRV